MMDYQKKRKLKIVHISTFDIAGGAEKVAWRLVKEQCEAGHDACIIASACRDRSGRSVSFNSEASTEMQALCRSAGFLYYEYQGSHKLLKHSLIKSADIIHLHNLHGDYFNPFSLILLSAIKPVVWTLHDMQSFTGHCAHSFDCEKWITGCGLCPVLNVYPQILYDRTAQLWQDKKNIYEHAPFWVTTPSKWLKEKVGYSILKKHPMELIYNGVDTNIFKPYDRLEVRKKFGISEDVILIGSVANLGALVNTWKGGVYTLEALKALKGKISNCAFLNIGGNETHNDSFIIDLPRINDENELAMVYSLFDIFISTSVADNCPLTILEAMACGVPIVTFATGGIPELVRDGIDGFVVGYKDTDSLIEALIKLSLDNDLRHKFSINARHRAESYFEQEMVVQSYENLYLRCIDEWDTGRKQINPMSLSEISMLIKTRTFMDGYEEVFSVTDNSKQALGITTELFDDILNQSTEPRNIVIICCNAFASFKKYEYAKMFMKVYLDKFPYDKEVQEYFESIEMVLSKVEALNLIGESFFERGDIRGAKNAFVAALDICPDFVAACNNIAVLFWQSREIEESQKYFERAVKSNPFDNATVYNYINVLIDLKQYGRAIEILRNYVKSVPEDIQMLKLLEKLEGIPQKEYRYE
ncbi:MAG: glycosyltransferase [Nitrospirae bacterium]|nr:glycosyltransferase [Nitrospirota bacterium]